MKAPVQQPPSASRLGDQWSVADLSELDAALQLDKEALYKQRLAVDTVEVSPRMLWELNRHQMAAQRAAQRGRAARWRSFYNRSILGMPLLHEGSRILSWWKRIMMFIDLTYTTFYIPLTLVMWERYQITYSEEARVLFVIDGVLGAFFFVNLMIQLHSPVRVSANFYQLLVQYGMGVFRVYRTKGTFWIDMATALPWFMQVVVPFVDPASAQGVITVMMVLRLVRLMRVVLLVKLLARGELFPRSSSRLLSVSSLYLISLVFSALATINLLACVWYATGSKSHQQVTWMDDAGGRDISGDPKWVKYLAAVYFTVTTLTTVGYGDIRAHNNLEMAVAIVIMLIGALFMSFVIGTVAAILNSASDDARRNQAFRSKVAHLDRFFKTHQTSHSIEREVYLYYYYVWTRCQQEEQEWQEVVGDLPSGLRGRLTLAVLSHSCGRLLGQLTKGVPQAVLLVLFASMERHVLSPGTVLTAAGSPVDAIWLLRHGSVMEVHPEAMVSAQLSAVLCEDASLVHAHKQQQHRRQGRRSNSYETASAGANGTGRPAGKAIMATSGRHLPLAAYILAHRRQQQLQQPGVGVDQSPARLPGQDSNSSGLIQDDIEAATTETCVSPAAAAGRSDEESQPQPQLHAATAACNETGREHQSHQQHLLKMVAGPCMFPDYAAQQLSGLQPSGTSGCGSSNGSCPDTASVAQGQQQQQHPVWLRTDGLCVTYRMDLVLVRQLCEVCPQLAANLTALLKQAR